MKIGFISICTMMLLFYGTECQAAKSSETAVSQQKYRVFSKNKKNALRSEKRRKAKEEQESSEDDNETVGSNSEENSDEKEIEEPKKNPWFRDKRSFADVVRGVKKEEVSDSEDDETVVGDDDSQQKVEENDDDQQDVEERVPQPSKKAKKGSKSKGKNQAKIDSGKRKYEARKNKSKSALKDFK